ncbi:MAG TPA: hypothetical protein VIJ60_05610, partial [Acidimicrobiales bacterium]
TVPPDQTCNLSNSTVRGNVTVQADSSIDLENTGTVGGSLLVGTGASSFEDTGWTISGPSAADDAGSMSFAGTVHAIVGNNTGTLGLSSATVDGSILWNKGLYGGVIGSSVIAGQVVLNGTVGDPTVGGTWLIAGPQLDGSPQEIDGNLVLTNNQVPIYVLDNHIKQNLVCEGNNPAPFTSLSGFATPSTGGRSASARPPTRPPEPAPPRRGRRSPPADGAVGESARTGAGIGRPSLAPGWASASPGRASAWISATGGIEAQAAVGR